MRSTVRLELFALFAGTALVLPTTAHLAAHHGWSAGTSGTVIAAMTVLAVGGSPMWGHLDDRSDGLAIRLAATVGAACAAALWASSTFGGFSEWQAIPLLLIFGAASGGMEPLLSARIQRMNLMSHYPSIRLFGTWGWLIGLGAAAVLTAFHQPGYVYLLAAGAFAVLLRGRIEARRDEQRSPQGDWRLPGRAALFILLGIPVPVSAYFYLIYSPAGISTVGLLPPYGTLMTLALLEVPAFALVQRYVPGHRIAPTYLVLLGFLFTSWISLLIARGNAVIFIGGLICYTIAVALWMSAQVNLIRSLSPTDRAALHQSLASASTKVIAAVTAGVGAGVAISLAGEQGAVVLGLALSAAALIGVAALKPFSFRWDDLTFPQINPSTIER